ncbi:inositol 2-dehydrogenase [Thermoflavimicrobium dichotomicum]|uniref:Scyllo-inositol 2-dehydrogenase (NAD+) n=1 Tax=Thermoflavimicrobium dichotomicum TaxID=46223 RepID=A0A1I3V253_9BACL|nr:inositol 2-dehydrogenase [Thermoflavimicrobium dichotomicum]SFJ88247.1 scyllo-inositol 2-dehydrogenase (NAD+) [Thermoflavimicrobium dichotomicum]
MREQIRCAVFGLGRLGYWHAENLAGKVKGAKLSVVVDPQEKIAEKVAHELGVQWSTSSQSILEDSEIDAVIIAVPTAFHADMIKLAAQHGKHIFVEKPLTQTLEEADEVIDVIRENGIFCQVGFMRRFDPAYAEAKRRIDAGDIGKPIYFKSISRDPGSPPAEFIQKSGGIFLDLSIHDYDLARFLMGAEVESVHAHGTVLLHPFMKECGDADQALAYLTFDSGAAGDVEGSRNAMYGYDIFTEVVGTEGSIRIGSLRHHDVQLLTDKGSVHDIVPHFPVRFKESYLLEMNHFIDCLRKEEKPSVTEIDGKKALEISMAAKISWKTGQRVHVGEKVKQTWRNES